MTVKPLNNISFNELMACFFKSFENYFVEMPTELNYYKLRWELAKVNYKLSYGMFDNGKLVGFIINGIDKRNGHIIAFNTGTGVLPEYRGRKIVKSIYDFALKDLRENGITKCSLEVIKKNLIAIKSYQSIGFRKCRTLKCYKGQINIKQDNFIDLVEKDFNQIDWNGLPNQIFYSWDNHSNTIKNMDYRYFQVLNQNQPESYCIINSNNGYLAQFELLQKESVNWKRLFLGIKSISHTIKINNVDHRLTDKIKFLSSIGIENTIDQYEMELEITSSTL